jgi:HPt (histidine-containing phosphotransfer) domain-containing protein
MSILERHAHSLKGAVGNLSANPAAAAAFQLEKDARNKNAESARKNLAEVERAVTQLMPALADLCVGASK